MGWPGWLSMGERGERGEQDAKTIPHHLPGENLRALAYDGGDGVHWHPI